MTAYPIDAGSWSVPATVNVSPLVTDPLDLVIPRSSDLEVEPRGQELRLRHDAGVRFWAGYG
jgi:hypothetical protein